ncbi:MAG TPA: uroporphyrinogen decarboxylase [Thermoanaerobaculia bacterium]|nr:uroporphyrinogen decarboxylase [Thermoanaerobaculia bacterium]HQR67339.1 uroporphyrinogen decarboxylase [Thermoanaerobaculia bacterium]
MGGDARNRPSRRRFVEAAFGRPVDRPPVWLMRQAGRYLPEYREVRKRLKFLDLCADVPSAIEVTLQPFRRFAMDGIVIFSDILIPLPAMGLGIRLDEGGPEIPEPVRTGADVERLHGFDPEKETSFVLEIHRGLKREVHDEAATIGFCGAPWTLATYAVEGGGSKSFPAVKTLMHRDPAVLEALLAKLADAVGDYLAAQIRAGADVVQVFDTWAGELSRADYDRFARPATERLIARLPRRGEVPVILFASGSSHLVDSFAKMPVDVVSVDWKLPLDEARRRAPGKALQGNVDPGVLLGTPEGVTAAVLAARRAAGPVGHIVNLGHGILPPTPPENVAAFVSAARLPL